MLQVHNKQGNNIASWHRRLADEAYQLREGHRQNDYERVLKSDDPWSEFDAIRKEIKQNKI